MQVGDWAYCEDEDIHFKVLATKDFLLQKNVTVWINQARCVKVSLEECRRCHKQVPQGQVSERYSFTVYAGKMCDECAYNSYRDHCGLDGGQGNPADLDEELEPDDWGL